MNAALLDVRSGFAKASVFTTFRRDKTTRQEAVHDAIHMAGPIGFAEIMHITGFAV